MTDKKYTAPDFIIERFSVNKTVASGCDTSSYESWSEITVDCVLTGSEAIFTSEISCENEVSINSSGSTWFFTTYDNTLYFCWVGASTSSSNLSTESMTLLRNILAENGITDPVYGNGYVWHAAPATGYLTTIYSMSY